MADRIQDIAEIVDEESLRAYLRSRPIAEAQVLALRSALRVMPKAAYARKKLIAAVFRALVFSWAARKYPIGEKSFAVASAFAAGAAGEVSQISPVMAAATAAADVTTAVYDANESSRVMLGKLRRAKTLVITRDIVGSRANVAGAAAIARSMAAICVVSSASASTTEASSIWNSARFDLVAMRETSVEECFLEPLWPEGFEPESLADWEADFRRSLDQFDPEWRLVSSFYQALRDGQTPFLGLGDRTVSVLRALAEEQDSFWRREPDAVMRDLAERLGVGNSPHLPEVIPNKATEKVDFFISYSTRNEAEAREINGYLEDAGYSTIVQFKDFAVGSNFVIEMQEALERGARAIVLLSPDYVASDHCRAEWAAIYNMDPLGKERKLVPLLLKPASLNKLARQIVYKSLFGLKVEERRAAVLEAIGHRSEPLPTDMLKRRLAETASPDVAPTTDGKLDAVPNPVYDRPVLDADLPDLPEVLKSLCRVIKSSLPDNSPRTVAPTLQEYSDHVSERRVRPIVNLLCMLADALKRDMRSVEFDVWGDGLSTHFESFFSCHSQFITHFPKAQEREELIASNAMDEDKASGKDFIAPVTKVAEALSELHLIGGTTPAFERVVQGSLQTAKDIDSLPMDPDAGQQGKITPKRRFVFSQIGFWERILSALGSMTTLATTEQGRAAIAALSEAIKKFLSFISSN